MSSVYGRAGSEVKSSVVHRAGGTPGVSTADTSVVAWRYPSRWSGVMRIRIVTCLLIVLAASAVNPSRAGAADDPWSWPVDRTGVDRRFDPPASDYGSGHRGVDVLAPVGSVVRSVAPGIVTFAGRVGSVDVVTIDHGSSRSTYQPVRSTVQVGDAVDRGDPIGLLQSGPSHCATACLHLGRVTADGAYLDPMDVLGGGRFRLVTPDGPPPAPPAGAGTLRRPVAGHVTSSYGMRVHPITGVRKLHDGTDFGASCGTRVRAAGPGTVVRTPTDRGYGKRIIIEHAAGLRTGYAHLSSRSVRVGQTVRTGTVIGRVGSTGLSTGCHLHFMVWKHGHLMNPMALL